MEVVTQSDRARFGCLPFARGGYKTIIKTTVFQGDYQRSESATTSNCALRPLPGGEGGGRGEAPAWSAKRAKAKRKGPRRGPARFLAPCLNIITHHASEVKPEFGPPPPASAGELNPRRAGGAERRGAKPAQHDRRAGNSNARSAPARREAPRRRRRPRATK